MAKVRGKVSGRVNHRAVESADCDVCWCLRTFIDSGISGVLSAYGFGVDESSKSPSRGAINLVTNRYFCSVHGDVK